EGAGGTLRFDSPGVVLPPIKDYAAQAELAVDQVEKSRSVARALVGAIKQARWGFTWSTDGTLRIGARTDGRVQTSFQDWLKEPANAGNWRKKTMEMLTNFIEQDLGLRAQTVDREILLCFTPQDSSLPLCPAALHPPRSAPEVRSHAAGKAELSYKRLAPAKEGTSIVIPSLATEVHACFQKVTTTSGRAVHDTKMRMLDSLDEEYEAELLYTSGVDTLRQELQVEYHLKRLAPQIIQRE
ncbi:MAG: hypothetical protein ABSE73_29915, partial [Planctomycetota bacterium]